MTRIKTGDSIKDVIMNMSERNIGASFVVTCLTVYGGEIDSSNVLGGMGNLLTLDLNGIYGSRIWMLFKDVCNEDLVNMVIVIQAVQLGIIPIDVLNHAIDNYGDGIDIKAITEEVCSQVKINLEWKKT